MAVEEEVRRYLTLILENHEYEKSTQFDKLQDDSIIVKLRPYYTVNLDNYTKWLKKQKHIITKKPLILQTDLTAPAVDREIDFYVDIILRERLNLSRPSTKNARKYDIRRETIP